MTLFFDKKYLEKLNLLDLFFSYQLITDEEYTLMKKIKESYKKCKDFTCIASYMAQRIQGGKLEDKITEIYETNRYYFKLQRLISNNIDILKDTILIDKQAIYYYIDNNIDYNDDKFNNFCNIILKIIDDIYNDFNNGNFENKLNELSEKIKDYKIIKLSKIIKISPKTIRKIINKDKTCSLNVYYKLFNFFKIKI